jgi:hypothetical protein
MGYLNGSGMIAGSFIVCASRLDRTICATVRAGLMESLGVRLGTDTEDSKRR